MMVAEEVSIQILGLGSGRGSMGEDPVVRNFFNNNSNAAPWVFIFCSNLLLVLCSCALFSSSRCAITSLPSCALSAVYSLRFRALSAAYFVSRAKYSSSHYTLSSSYFGALSAQYSTSQCLALSCGFVTFSIIISCCRSWIWLAEMMLIIYTERRVCC